jgi:hypothetical protein
MAYWKTVENASKKDTEIIDPSVMEFAGASCQ